MNRPLALIAASTALLVAPDLRATTDLQRLVDDGVAAGASVIRIPAGRYEVAPRDGIHLKLKGLRDVTIDATGVEMVCTETTLAVHVEDCVNLRLVGLTIDYDPLPFTQGRIVEIGTDRKSHVIEIDEGFPPAAAAYVFKHSIYTPEGELRFGSYYQFQLEVLGERRLRVHGLSSRVDGGEQVGDIAIVSTEHLSGRYVPHAVQVDDSRGTVLEDVTIFSSPCFGFFEQGSSGSTYLRCVVDRRAGRVHSLNADAFHSKYAEVGPRIVESRAMWMGDDAVNICGEFYLVAGSNGPTVRVLSTGILWIREGDALQVVAASGERLADARAVAIEREGPLTDADRDLLRNTVLYGGKPGRMRHVFRVTLDRDVEFAPGAVIASEDRMGRGFAVVDNHFGNNRSRGILVKASDGEIRGNRLVNTHMQAILVAPEYRWLESGFSSNVVVADNVIERPGREAIRIAGVGPFAGHRNLEIRDNRIVTEVRPALRIESVRGGILRDNEIRDPEGQPVADAITVEHCEDLDPPAH